MRKLPDRIQTHDPERAGNGEREGGGGRGEMKDSDSSSDTSRREWSRAAVPGLRDSVALSGSVSVRYRYGYCWYPHVR